VTDAGLLFLRVGVAGLLIPLHGWNRLIAAYEYLLFGEAWGFVHMVERLGFPLPLVFALLSTVAESIAAALMAMGALTRSAALLLAVNMTVAVTSEAMQGAGFELPALYLACALAVAIAGPGVYSLDHVQRSRRTPL
jgi:putative oxidoreductase